MKPTMNRNYNQRWTPNKQTSKSTGYYLNQRSTNKQGDATVFVFVFGFGQLWPAGECDVCNHGEKIGFGEGVVERNERSLRFKIDRA